MVNLPSRLQVATLTTADIIALRMLFHDARQVTLAWLKRQPPVGIARLCHDLSLFWVRLGSRRPSQGTSALPRKAAQRRSPSRNPRSAILERRGRRSWSW